MLTLNNENYLTRLEAAKILGISMMTMHRWIKKGKIEIYKMSERKTFIKESKLKDIIK